MGLTRRKRKAWKTKFGLAFTYHIFVPLFYVMLRLLRLTWRIEKIGAEVLKDRPFILTIWHGDMYTGATEIPFLVPADVVSSLSNDGRAAARLTSFFGAGIIDGSSSRGQLTALRGMLRSIRAGRSFIISVDGPRGPAHEVKSGVVHIASQMRKPIIPGAAQADRYWKFRSWDGAFLPKPFARVRLVYGNPINVPAKADEQMIEEARLILESEIRRLHAVHAFGNEFPAV